MNIKNYKTKFDKSVSLLCWAYNEEESIGGYLERATNLMDCAVNDYEIVLIDDGSTDRTYEVSKVFQVRNPRLKIFRNEKNLDVGISAQKAIQNAKKEYLLWQTIDWSYDISDLRSYLELLKSYDIIQGVRRKPVKVKFKFLKPFISLLKIFGIKHLTKRSDTIFKAIISVINYILIRCLFRVPLSDFQNVTIYPSKWIQSIKFESKSPFTNPEGLIKSYWNEMTIKEVPINFIPREKGKGNGTRFKSIRGSFFDIISLWFKWIVMGKRGLVRKGKIIRLDSIK